MVRFVRSARIRAGRYMDAMQWAQEVARLFNRKYAPIQVKVFTPVTGDVQMVQWVADYADLAQVDENRRKLQADEEYLALLNKVGAGAKDGSPFVDGGIRDYLFSEAEG